MSNERPETLLRSALEKIVYFEARSEQLGNDLAGARAEADRLKTDLAQASQREIELRRTIAELEVKLKRAHSEREEMGRVNEAMRRDRAALIGKLVEASRIHGQGHAQGDQPFELASFISELRGEVLFARAQKSSPAETAPVQKTPGPDNKTAMPVDGAGFRASSGSAPALPAIRPPTPPPPVDAPPEAHVSTTVEHAQRLQSEGRLKVSAENISELSNANGFRGRTEETLFGFSVRELSSPDAPARARAAERLKSLGARAGAAPLATALHAETEPALRVVLLQAFASLASHEGASVVSPLLSANEPEVRIAALKALIALDPAQAGPHLTAAMKDPDRAVRRRASLMALGLTEDAALKLGAQAMADADSEVRSLAVLVLGAGSGQGARSLLLSALRDPERKVRRAASEALGRMLGQDLSSIVELDDAQRRREIRRLSEVPIPTGRNPRNLSDVHPADSETRPVPPNLCETVMTEVRAAIRGRSVDELEAAVARDRDAIHQACETLIASGQVVRRGAKYFVA